MTCVCGVQSKLEAWNWEAYDIMHSSEPTAVLILIVSLCRCLYAQSTHWRTATYAPRTPTTTAVTAGFQSFTRLPYVNILTFTLFLKSLDYNISTCLALSESPTIFCRFYDICFLCVLASRGTLFSPEQ